MVIRIRFLHFLPHGFSAGSILRMLWQHKLAIGAISLVLSAFSLMLVRRIPVTYRAEAVIAEHFAAGGSQDELSTISRQVLSDPHLQKLIDDMGLYRGQSQSHTRKENISRMRNDIEIGPPAGARPGVLRVAFRYPSPEEAAAVANGIAKLFVESNHPALAAEAQEAKEKLDRLEAAVKRYAENTKGEPGERESAWKNTLRAELRSSEEAIQRTRQAQATVESALRAAGSVPHGSEASADAAGKSSLQPSAASLAAQLRFTKLELERRKAKRQGILQELALYHEQQETREQQRQAAVRNYENAKAEYEALLQKETGEGAALGTGHSARNGRFNLLEPARVPQEPFQSDRWLGMALGIAGSVICAVMFVIGKELRRHGVLGEWELPEGVEMIGRVPVIECVPRQDRKWHRSAA
jgi:hypothetical protein